MNNKLNWTFLIISYKICVFRLHLKGVEIPDHVKQKVKIWIVNDEMVGVVSVKVKIWKNKDLKKFIVFRSRL